MQRTPRRSEPIASSSTLSMKSGTKRGETRVNLLLHHRNQSRDAMTAYIRDVAAATVPVVASDAT